MGLEEAMPCSLFQEGFLDFSSQNPLSFSPITIPHTVMFIQPWEALCTTWKSALSVS